MTYQAVPELFSKELCDHWIHRINETLAMTEFPGLNVKQYLPQLSKHTKESLALRQLQYDISQHWYLTRVKPGHNLGKHQDGTVRDDAANPRPRRSCATLLVYLNDDFDKGHLKVYDAFEAIEPVSTIRPCRGLAVIINSDTWHAAVAPSNTCKYLLRTNLFASDALQG